MINLCPDKKAVFAEAARVVRAGGGLAIADIISEQTRSLHREQVIDALWADLTVEEASAPPPQGGALRPQGARVP